MTRSEFLKSVISSRKYLIKHGASKKNAILCNRIIEKLERQIEAYGEIWDEQGWKNFLRRNYEDIIFIIPGNLSANNKLETLNSLVV